MPRLGSRVRAPLSAPSHASGRFSNRPFSYRRRSGQVVRQRPAKPLPPVRIRASPPDRPRGPPKGGPLFVRGSRARVAPAARCGARTPDGGDSVGVPLRPIRLRNPPAPAAGVPLRLPDPGAFPNEARNPIWHGPKTVQMGFSAPFGIRTFAEGGRVLGRFLDTLLSIKHYLSIMHQLYVSLHMWSTYPLLKKSLRGILSQ